MRLTVEIPKNKALTFLKYVKKLGGTKVYTQEDSENAMILNDIDESVKYLNQVLKGKKKARPVKKLLDEI